MITPRILMCAPSYFGVDYIINPWMEGQVGQVNHALAVEQWEALVALIRRETTAQIEFIEPQAGLPDMVFTANAGVVDGNEFYLSRFWHPERQGEEPFFRAWFEGQGRRVHDSTEFHEGAGDMLFWTAPEAEPLLVCASGFRTVESTHTRIAQELNRPYLSVKLATHAFYHLDTCFCPLPGGFVIWYPPAFEPESQAAIRRTIPDSLRFELPEEDAVNFAGNAVGLPDAVVMGFCGPQTRSWLEGNGFRVLVTPLGEFLKAGGSAKCLTLRIDTGLV